MPGGTILVDPAALAGAAQRSTELATALRPVAESALAAGRAAGSALAGWSVSDALAALAESWRPALDSLAQGLDSNAAGLRTGAAGHTANERATAHGLRSPRADGFGVPTAPPLGALHADGFGVPTAPPLGVPDGFGLPTTATLGAPRTDGLASPPPHGPGAPVNEPR